MNRPRLVLATTVWKRPHVTSLVLRHYAAVRDRLSPRIELRLLAVGSEGSASRDLCRRHGFEYVEHANNPVTYKWNRVIGAARGYAPEGVILVNSDDLVSAALFPLYVDAFRSGEDYVGLRGTDVVDLRSLQHGRWPGYEASYMKFRVGEPAGCGRGFSRRLLDRTSWTLWPRTPPRDSSMDFWCTQFVRLHGVRPRALRMEAVGVEAVQIKTDVNLTTLDRLPLVGIGRGDGAFEVIRRAAGDAAAAEARAIHESMAPGVDHEAPYRYASASRAPIHRIEDIPVSERHGDTVALLRAMRDEVLGCAAPSG
jgi:hypothetical protein